MNEELTDYESRLMFDALTSEVVRGKRFFICEDEQSILFEDMEAYITTFCPSPDGSSRVKFKLKYSPKHCEKDVVYSADFRCINHASGIYEIYEESIENLGPYNSEKHKETLW